jgi:hypothetical protein
MADFWFSAKNTRVIVHVERDIVIHYPACRDLKKQ